MTLKKHLRFPLLVSTCLETCVHCSHNSETELVSFEKAWFTSFTLLGL